MIDTIDEMWKSRRPEKSRVNGRPSRGVADRCTPEGPLGAPSYGS